MTDLAKGIISFDEFTLTSTTVKSELMSVYGHQLSALSNDKILYFKRLFKVENAEFMCTFYFDKEYKIASIELRPSIAYKSEKWDRTGQQEERRVFCDKWLYDRLGEPVKNAGGASYVFSNIEIDVITHFDQRNGADAGYILIEYIR